MKKLAITTYILLIAVCISSCTKSDDSIDQEKPLIPKELQGTWYSQGLEQEGFFELDFRPEAIRFTIQSNDRNPQTQVWTDFDITGSGTTNNRVLIIRHYDDLHGQDAEFKYPFVLSSDGSLFVENLAPSLLQIVGRYPGDRHWYGNILFGRDKF